MKKLTWPLALLILQPLTSLGCRSTSVGAVEPTTPATQRAEPRTAVPQTGDYIPEGTVLRARLNDQISTESSTVGDRFTLSVLDDVRAANGEVAIPAGSIITGTVASLDSSTHVGDQASVELRFDSIAVGGRSYPVTAQIEKAEVKQSPKGSTIAKGAGGGALGGAALGAILGGGSGAVKGGLLGAAGGTLLSLGIGDVEEKLPAGSAMTLRLSSPIDKR